MPPFSNIPLRLVLGRSHVLGAAERAVRERPNEQAADSCQETFLTLSGLASGMRLPGGGRGKRRRE